MPLGLNNIETMRWFLQPSNAGGKSLQYEWQFYGMFLFDPFSSKTKSAFGKIADPKTGVTNLLKSVNEDFPPVIQSFHIKGVSVPTYEFEKKQMMYGQIPRSFPLLNAMNMDLQIDLEEDDKGSVDYFINWNQRRIIDSDGYYNSPNSVKLKAFVLEVQDKQGLPIVYYTFHDIFFLNGGTVKYSYGGNGPIQRSITFGCDRMSTIYIKQNAVAQALSFAQALI